MSQDDFDREKKYINGPVNVARLEGSVGSVKKVIYLFMDWHIPIEQQLKCSNIYADDISKYLLNGFAEAKRLNEGIDFFLEIRPSESNVLFRDFTSITTTKVRDRSMMYIETMMHLFLKLFNYDKEKHKVFRSQYLENVRIHYADIRDLFLAPNSDMMLFRLGDVVQNIYALNSGQFNNTINLLKRAGEEWISVRNFGKKCLEKSSSCNVKANLIVPVKDKNDLDNRYKYVFYKMIHKYNHNDIQKIMVDLVKSELDNISQIVKLINRYGKLLVKTYNTRIETFGRKHYPTNAIKQNYQYIAYSYNPVENLEMETSLAKIAGKMHAAIKLCIGFMDIYFLRRFLDKDYINTVVAYTGALHSSNYIRILLQKFNFKITHISNSNGMTIPQLNDAVLKTKHLAEVEYLLYPETFGQCSDMTTFPPNFE